MKLHQILNLEDWEGLIKDQTLLQLSLAWHIIQDQVYTHLIINIYLQSFT